MKKSLFALTALAVLLAGCGSVEDEVSAPAAQVTEQTSRGREPEETFVMTTIFGTTAAGSEPAEKGAETTTVSTTATKTNTELPVMKYTTSWDSADMSDTADTFTQSFLDTIVSAEYRDFGEKRYIIEDDLLGNVKSELSAFHGRICGDPVLDGGYFIVLKDSGGNEHYIGLMNDYIVFDGTFYHDPEYDPDGMRNIALADYFRNYGRRVDEAGNDIPEDKLNEVTAQFELVQASPSGKSAYAVSDVYGLVNFSVTNAEIQTLPAGTMLNITWSGMIAEIYPAILEGVTNVTRANDLANPDRPDFVSAHLDTLVEACRGKDDYYTEIDKLPNLKKGEKDALFWLVGNKLTE